MTGSSERAKATPAASRRAGNSRWPAAAIVVLLCLFALAMYERNSIRAYWWASRLAAAGDLRTRAYYIASLTAVGESAAGAINRLAQDARPEVRALAIPAMTRLSERSRLATLRGLLLDPDADVGESAATALAFMGSESATRILIEHAQSDRSGTAAAAAAALARLPTSRVVTTLCKVVASYPEPFVRAQAVESLAACVAGEAPYSESKASPSQEACDPVLVLVSALEDRGAFTGHLALERQITALTNAASVSAVPPAGKATRLHVDAAPASAPVAPRTVADVAAHWLSTLTGLPVAPVAGRTSAEQAELADQCHRAMAERRRTTQPAELPPGEASRAESADTQSSADHPD